MDADNDMRRWALLGASALAVLGLLFIVVKLGTQRPFVAPKVASRAVFSVPPPAVLPPHVSGAPFRPIPPPVTDAWGRKAVPGPTGSARSAPVPGANPFTESETGL